MGLAKQFGIEEESFGFLEAGVKRGQEEKQEKRERHSEEFPRLAQGGTARRKGRRRELSRFFFSLGLLGGEERERVWIWFSF